MELGHRRVAYCTGGFKSNVAKSREAGFKKALAEFNVEFRDEFSFCDAFTIEDGRRVFQEILALEEKPSAIFTGGDEVAAGIISEAKRSGWKIPEDLAVVGFDNQAITELVEPTITTVYQPIDEMARKAFQVMMDKVRSKRYRQKEIYEYDLELIVRESTVKQGVYA